MAWVPGPITLDKLDPATATPGLGTIVIHVYGQGFRPTTSLVLTLADPPQNQLVLADFEVLSPNEMTFTINVDDPTVVGGSYDARASNPPADGTTEQDNTTTLPSALTLVR